MTNSKRRGGQPGNQNAKGKGVGRTHWRDAIRKVVAEYRGDKKVLDLVARRLIDAALDGDVIAIKEIGNRLDGMPRQSVDADVNASLTVEIVRFARKDPK